MGAGRTGVLELEDAVGTVGSPSRSPSRSNCSCCNLTIHLPFLICLCNFCQEQKACRQNLHVGTEPTEY